MVDDASNLRLLFIVHLRFCEDGEFMRVHDSKADSVAKFDSVVFDGKC